MSSTNFSVFSFQKILVGIALSLLIVLSVLGAIFGDLKVLTISWLSFFSMTGAIPIGIRSAHQKKSLPIVNGYGMASGAMVVSAAIFLAPIAIRAHPAMGLLGVVIGISIGFTVHTITHRSFSSRWKIDSVLVELMLHTLFAGFVIGFIYASMPGLSLLLGIAIISHKAPAGYAAARYLNAKEENPWLLLLPACGIGLTALPVSMIDLPGIALLNASIFGLATGIFFHVAFNFLRSSMSSEIEFYTSHTGRNWWAVLNMFVGGGIVYLLWVVSR
ncbi:MAG TPA: hypothetical protein VE868_10665 [Balneolaceae bacterium]|nr:hypothetical protein [Balneolaceae bacterium]